MTKGIPKKRQRDEQLRKKRAQAASALDHGAATPLRPIRVPSAAKRASVGLPAHRYPVTRSSIGKRQVPGGAGQIEGEAE